MKLLSLGNRQYIEFSDGSYFDVRFPEGPQSEEYREYMKQLANQLVDELHGKLEAIVKERDGFVTDNFILKTALDGMTFRLNELIEEVQSKVEARTLAKYRGYLPEGHSMAFKKKGKEVMEFKAPTLPEGKNYVAGYEIFLAGSIEMGAAELWQDKVVKIVDEYDPSIVIYNPRRDDWDSSWKQSITDPQFNEQVNWELDQLERSEIAFFYFDPKTKSPITLMELGTMVNDMWKDEVIVCCPEGFWRRGNIEVVCHRNGFSLFDNFDDAIEELKKALERNAS